MTAQEHVGPKVVLVGAMGSGKTTVARILAEKWGVEVRDTDADIEAAAGMSVQDIFVDAGEERFRELERAAVATALSEHDGVLALGGGAVLAPENRAALAGHRVAHLQVGLSDAVKRVGLGETRPVLNQAIGGVRVRIKQLLDERAPLYAEVATFTVDTGGRTPAEVADAIAGAIDDEIAEQVDG